jgi:hypothetical protein
MSAGVVQDFQKYELGWLRIWTGMVRAFSNFELILTEWVGYSWTPRFLDKKLNRLPTKANVMVESLGVRVSGAAPGPAGSYICKRALVRSACIVLALCQCRCVDVTSGVTLVLWLLSW